MYRIAICDDDAFFIEQMKGYIITCTTRLRIECVVDTFLSASDLLAIGNDILQYNIVFLDISMEKINGIEAAIWIRRYSDSIYIVFVTAYIKYAIEGYKVGVIRYILKDNKTIYNSVDECIKAIIKKTNSNNKKIVVKTVEGDIKVPVERIVYIESNLHKVEYHLITADNKSLFEYNC